MFIPKLSRQKYRKVVVQNSILWFNFFIEIQANVNDTNAPDIELISSVKYTVNNIICTIVSAFSGHILDDVKGVNLRSGDKIKTGPVLTFILYFTK